MSILQQMQQQYLSTNITLSKIELKALKNIVDKLIAEVSPGVIYFISDNNGAVKIGYTKKMLNHRLRELQTGNKNTLTILGSIRTMKVENMEKDLHETFKDYLIRGEWFDDSILTENMRKHHCFIEKQTEVYLSGNFLNLIDVEPYPEQEEDIKLFTNIYYPLYKILSQTIIKKLERKSLALFTEN